MQRILHVLMTTHSKLPVASYAEHGRVMIVMQQRRIMGLQGKHRTTWWTHVGSHARVVKRILHVLMTGPSKMPVASSFFVCPVVGDPPDFV